MKAYVARGTVQGPMAPSLSKTSHTPGGCTRKPDAVVSVSAIGSGRSDRRPGRRLGGARSLGLHEHPHPLPHGGWQGATSKAIRLQLRPGPLASSAKREGDLILRVHLKRDHPSQ